MFVAADVLFKCSPYTDVDEGVAVAVPATEGVTSAEALK